MAMTQSQLGNESTNAIFLLSCEIAATRNWRLILPHCYAPWTGTKQQSGNNSLCAKCRSHHLSPVTFTTCFTVGPFFQQIGWSGAICEPHDCMVIQQRWKLNGIIIMHASRRRLWNKHLPLQTMTNHDAYMKNRWSQIPRKKHLRKTYSLGGHCDPCDFTQSRGGKPHGKHSRWPLKAIPRSKKGA